MSEPLPELVDRWIADRRVRSRRGLSSNSERAYRNDLAGFVRRLADAQGIDRAELCADDPWGRQNQQLARVDHRAFTDENLAFVFGQMVADGAATASRARMLSAIRGFCQWMVRSGHLELDPTLAAESDLSRFTIARLVSGGAWPEFYTLSRLQEVLSIDLLSSGASR